ncbi:formyltransferase family protein [bacterium]|nr:formyltransferase family protein [bacterium]
MSLVLAVSKPLGLGVLKSVQSAVDCPIVVVTCDDRADTGRTAFLDIADTCEQSELELLVHSGTSFNDYLIVNRPDICLVSGWYWIINDMALDACRLGCFAIHNSLLPSFRGSAPLVWSIIAGAEEVGASLFKMTSAMDEGPLVCQWSIDISEGQTITEALGALEDVVERDIGVLVCDLLVGRIEPFPQSSENVSYGPRRFREDSRVDWQLSTTALESHCRALQAPYPRMFFVMMGIEYEIGSVKPAGVGCFGPCGKVLAYVDGGMLVKCGSHDDGIILEQLVSEGVELDLREVRPFRIGTILADQ